MGEYTGRLHYGERILEGFLPKRIEDEGRSIPLTLPVGLPEIRDVAGALEGAISKSQTPAKVPDLKTILKKHYRGGLVSILVDDHARPNVHTRLLLPKLLDSLQSLGVKREKIRLIVAHGTHRASKPGEYPHIFGEAVWPAWKGAVEDHDCVKGVEVIGNLDDGHPVELNRTVFASEVVIGLSDLDYHYFAGMGGGPKQIIPGVAGKNTITSEHLKMFGRIGFAEHVEMGTLDKNPVYEHKRRLVQKIEDELRAKGSWLYAIVTVIDPEDKLVHIEGGEILDTHRRGESVLGRVCVARMPGPADVVIMSARHEGLDLYQAGKAFNSARHAVKRGGKIVVLAPCGDRWGNEEFTGLMAVAAPILKATQEKLRKAKAGEREKIGAKGVEEALLAVQEVVMRDFKIGKQKPVDLLVTEMYCGWGNLLMVQDGLTAEDEAMLPIIFIGNRNDPPEKRLRDWIVKLEEESKGKLSYCVVDDPALLIRVGK